MNSLLNNLVETRLTSPMTTCGGHAAYLVKSGKNRSYYQRKKFLWGEQT